MDWLRDPLAEIAVEKESKGAPIESLDEGQLPITW